MFRMVAIAATAVLLLAACSSTDPTAATDDDDDDGGGGAAEVSAEATTAGDVTWTFDVAVTDDQSARVRASHDADESCDVGFTITLLDSDDNVLAAGSSNVGGVTDTATATIRLDQPVDADAVADAEADTDLNACASDV